MPTRHHTPEAPGQDAKQPWTAPQLHEYDLKETKGGWINFNVELSWCNIPILGDCGSGFMDPHFCH